MLDRTHHWGGGGGGRRILPDMDHSPEGWPALVLPKRLGQRGGPEGLRISGSWVGLGPWGQSPGEARTGLPGREKWEGEGQGTLGVDSQPQVMSTGDS